jgi:hypothetical protein
MDKRLARAIKDSKSGTLKNVNTAFERVDDDPVLRQHLWDWVISNLTSEKIERKLARVLTSVGTDCVDLHGLRRPAALALAEHTFCIRAMSDTSGPVSLITGVGKHSPSGMSVLFADIKSLLDAARCTFTCPKELGIITVVVDAAFRTAWATYCDNGGFGAVRTAVWKRIVTQGSDNSVTHWNPAKQRGVDNVLGKKRTRMKTFRRDQRMQAKTTRRDQSHH